MEEKKSPSQIRQEERREKEIREATEKRMQEFKRKAEEKIESWRKLGMNAFKISTSGRDNVCAHCRAMDGKFIHISAAVVGTTLPPFLECKNLKREGCCCNFQPVYEETEEE